MPDLFGRSKLKEELEAWQKFSSSLPPSERAAFESAVENAMQYGDFFEDAPRGHETEAFLLSILLSQQKKIEELKRTFANQKKIERQNCRSICPQHLSPCENDHNTNEESHQHVTLNDNLCLWG
ncbi:MAG TPA: hypothetical protein VN739_03490 [Nitrososphaerales archaeon]|nr:hypothetical protein [Nitrososphaerales archaeon]